MIKIVLTIQVTATIYTYTVDSCKLHVLFKGKIKALATVAKSKPILLSTW